MDLGNQYNVRSPAVKRLMREAWEMQEPTEDFSASPVGDNLFEWHFTIRGASDSDFEGGIYHGRIIFPTEYPMKPPNILLFTPNGRFETNKKICLSISGHHPETWQPSWCVRTALLALIAFMPTPGNSTVGALDYTKEERQALARKSRSWECHECGSIINLLTSVDKNDNTRSSCSDTNSEYLITSENLVNSSVMNTSLPVEEKASIPTSPILSIQDETLKSTLNTNVFSPEVTETYTSSETSVSPMVTSSFAQFHHFIQFETISSNFSKSKVTVSIIIVLITLILYRRIFLLC